MSVQLREPLRSIRRIVDRPWPIYPTRNLVQGSSLPRSLQRTVILPCKAYTTAVAVRSTEEIAPTSQKVIASRLWQDYQLQHNKEVYTPKQFESVIKTLLDQAQHSKKSVFWSRIIQVYETARSLGQHATPAIYLTAMTAYGRAGDAEKVTTVFKEYRHRYRVKANANQHYLAAIVDTGDLSAAVRVFRDIKSNPHLTTNTASQCLEQLVPALCAKRTHIVTAMKVVEEMNASIAEWDPQVRQHITESLWQGYCKLSKLPPNSPITPLSAEQLIASYTNKRIASKVIPSYLLTLFNLLCHSDCVPTAKTCNLILDTLSLHNNYAGVKSVLSWMQKLNIQPTSGTVAILLRVFGTSLPSHQKQQLYTMLNRSEEKMDPDMFNIYLRAFSEDASQQKHAMRAAKDHGIEPDASIVVEGFVKRGELDQGIQWLQQAGSKNLDLYAIIMEKWLQKGQWKKCTTQYDALLQQYPNGAASNRRLVKCALTSEFALKKTGDNLLDHLQIKFTPNTIMRIIHTLLSLETKQGHPLVSGAIIVRALQKLESKLDVHLDADGIHHTIVGLGKRGECKQSYTLYQWVREYGQENIRKRCGATPIYLAMIESAVANNDMRLMERAWVDMQYRKRYYGKSDKVSHTLDSYNLLLNGYASRLPQPDLTRTKKVFQRLLQQGLKPNMVTYNILIKAFVGSNNMEAANQIFQKMSQLSGTQPDSRTINTLLNGWVIRKEWGQVEKFMKQQPVDMVTFNLLIQSFLQLDSKTMAYMHLLKQQHRWHELEKYKSKQPPMNSDTIWDIFKSTTGYSKQAITNFKQIKLKTNTLSICNQLCKLETQPVPNRSKAFIKLFSNAEADTVTYKLFMKAFVNIGDYRSAATVYRWMEHRLL